MACPERPISEIDRYAGGGGGPGVVPTLERQPDPRNDLPMAQRGNPARVTVSCHFWVARSGPGSEISIARSESAILDWKVVLSTLGTAVRNHVWWWTGGGGGGWQYAFNHGRAHPGRSRRFQA